MDIINFRQLEKSDKEVVFAWLEEPHVKEFWDNSLEHKNDIINFVNGRQAPSNYGNGRYVYWLAQHTATGASQPYAMLMTIKEAAEDVMPTIKRHNLSKLGNNYSIDFMIGNKDFVGKGYGAKTLEQFLAYFRKNYDQAADCFFIDPETNNSKAKHVYLKAGFSYIADFLMQGNSSGSGKWHHLLVCKFKPEISLKLAKKGEVNLLNNLAGYYHYELAQEFAAPADKQGRYHEQDYGNYLTDQNRRAYFIIVNKNIAGFILLNKHFIETDNLQRLNVGAQRQWFIGEFFVQLRYQKTSVGRSAVGILLKQMPGAWQASIQPANRQAIAFWQATIADLAAEVTSEKIDVSYDEKNPQRIVLSFIYKHIEHVQNYKWRSKRFSELSSTELYKILQIRQDIFLVEQNCFYQDIDDLDLEAMHIYAIEEKGQVAAYARIIPPGILCNEATFGRVLVAAHLRGQGLGKLITKMALEEIKKNFGKVPVKIAAQIEAEPMYKSFGFNRIADEYQDDGVMHVDMLKLN